MTTRLFGEPVQRREDPRLITGRGRFLDDLGAGAPAAAFVRSPHAHARILDVDVSAALDVDGLVAIYTWEDLPGALAEPLPLLIPHPALTHGRTAYPLAREIVRHVGEPVVMVVARDRYLAEDACALIRVDYEVLKPVVGLEEAAGGAHLVHDDVPGNIGAHLVQEVPGPGGETAGEAVDAAPHRLEFRLDVERSACTPLEGKGVYARWDADDASLRVYSSTQTSTSVRMAIAAKLGLPLPKVEVVAPDVGGGFGVKIVHPWPEEILVPWAARLLNREVKWTEDRREHFVSSSHERGQVQHVRVGFDDDGRLLGLEVEILHDHGAYTPYGIIVPIITSTQLLGPYKVGAYRVEFSSVYTNTVQVTPYRGAGRPQGVFCMERTMDKIAAYLGRDRTEVRAANFVQPDEFPYDQGLTFQDGRPLIYDSGDYPEALRMLKELIGWDSFPEAKARAAAEGRSIGIGVGCYVEGTGVGPYEGGHVQITSDGRVHVSTGLTSQGQGHETVFAQIAATELGVPIERVSVVTGDTRRFGYAVGTFASRAAVMSGNAIALACRKVRKRRCGSRPRRWRPTRATWRSPTGWSTWPARRRRRSRWRPSPCCPTRCGTPSTRRPSGPPSSPGPPPTTGRRWRRGGARPGGPRLLFAGQVDVRGRHARRDRGDRPGHRRDQDPAVRRRARLRQADQPDDRRGADPRRGRPGRRRRAVREDGLRRARPVAERLVHGLPDAVRHGDSAHRDGPPGDALAAQPPGDQGRRGGRGHPGLRRHRRRDRGRRGHPHRPDAHLPSDLHTLRRSP